MLIALLLLMLGTAVSTRSDAPAMPLLSVSTE